ncbi:hypothetical protein [Nesterenkonia alkaliphila]|uniref:hypothetical protein n=1 Tax=Nesterenkonia alkaliphila TaxID=1463631 RepID=UPI001E608161|nr:hypothetical protein [Nesterenkonia alkaliphila]
MGFLVLADVDAFEERLVRQASGLVVGALVHAGAVGQCFESAAEVLALAGLFFVVVLKFPVDVGQSGADAILVSFEGLEVDGVGEVGVDELLAFGLEPLPVAHQLGEFLRA